MRAPPWLAGALARHESASLDCAEDKERVVRSIVRALRAELIRVHAEAKLHRSTSAELLARMGLA